MYFDCEKYLQACGLSKGIHLSSFILYQINLLHMSQSTNQNATNQNGFNQNKPYDNNRYENRYNNYKYNQLIKTTDYTLDLIFNPSLITHQYRDNYYHLYKDLQTMTFRFNNKHKHCSFQLCDTSDCVIRADGSVKILVKMVIG